MNETPVFSDSRCAFVRSGISLEPAVKSLLILSTSASSSRILALVGGYGSCHRQSGTNDNERGDCAFELMNVWRGPPESFEQKECPRGNALKTDHTALPFRVRRP